MDWFWVKFGLAVATLLAIMAGVVWMIVEHGNWLQDQQEKEDACLKAGGMWIDNRNTDSYCFFNK